MSSHFPPLLPKIWEWWLTFQQSSVELIRIREKLSRLMFPWEETIMFYERGAKALRGVRIAAIAAATGLALLSGATSAAADTVVKWLHLETDPSYVAVWRKIADQYEVQHPGVKIQ